MFLTCLHMAKWYFISQIFAQSIALSRLICTVVAYMIELTLPRIFVSSAKSFIHAKITSGRSLMNTMNNIGSNTLPCGIPRVTFAESELFPFITTFCDLSVRNYFIQLWIFPLMPYHQSFFQQAFVMNFVKRLAEI